MTRFRPCYHFEDEKKVKEEGDGLRRGRRTTTKSRRRRRRTTKSTRRRRGRRRRGKGLGVTVIAQLFDIIVVFVQHAPEVPMTSLSAVRRGGQCQRTWRSVAGALKVMWSLYLNGLVYTALISLLELVFRTIWHVWYCEL